MKTTNVIKCENLMKDINVPNHFELNKYCIKYKKHTKFDEKSLFSSYWVDKNGYIYKGKNIRNYVKNMPKYKDIDSITHIYLNDTKLYFVGFYGFNQIYSKNFIYHTLSTMSNLMGVRDFNALDLNYLHTYYIYDNHTIHNFPYSENHENDIYIGSPIN